jgi:hypothetical protein
MQYQIWVADNQIERGGDGEHSDDGNLW